MQDRIKRKHWIIFLSLAICIHLILFLSFKASFFSIFRKSISSESSTAPGKFFSPDLIITLPVVIEDSKQVRKSIENTTNNETIQKPSDERLEKSPWEQYKITDEYGGNLQKPILSPGKGEILTIPPRPLEISWPDTKGLEHCLGRSIEFRILVGKDGRIISINPVDLIGQDKCTEAALQAAKKLVFAPGKIQGKPAQMWTEIRIEYRAQE